VLHAGLFLEAWDQSVTPHPKTWRLAPLGLMSPVIILRDTLQSRTIQSILWLTYPSPSPLASLHERWCRNINLLPITYALRPRLRAPTNPGRINLPQETLGFRRTGFSPVLSLLMSAYSPGGPPASLTVYLHRLLQRSPTTPYRASTVENPQLRHLTLAPLNFRRRLA
jgi:hypothetical protein